MTDIYQHAEQVLVCLSTYEWTKCLPKRLLRDIENAIPRGIEHGSKKEHAAAKKSGALFAKASPEEGQHFFEIFLCHWWKRAWVYQEFIVSLEAIFLCAGQAIH
jgi:hypothetical protein